MALEPPEDEPPEDEPPEDEPPEDELPEDEPPEDEPPEDEPLVVSFFAGLASLLVSGAAEGVGVAAVEGAVALGVSFGAALEAYRSLYQPPPLSWNDVALISLARLPCLPHAGQVAGVGSLCFCSHA